MTHESDNELADAPPDGKDGEQVLVRAGDKVQEDGRVDGQVAAYAKADHSEERGECDEVRCATRRKAEYAREEERDVEGPSMHETVSVLSFMSLIVPE